MPSREAAHINHSRRPPSQKEFGSYFFIPSAGLCTILSTPTKWCKNVPDHTALGRSISAYPGESPHEAVGSDLFRLVLLVVRVYHNKKLKSTGNILLCKFI